MFRRLGLPVSGEACGHADTLSHSYGMEGRLLAHALFYPEVV